MAGLLDFLADPQARNDIRQGFMDAVNRGAIGSVLGGPVDLANMALQGVRAGAGYVGDKTGLWRSDSLPQVSERPVGGSEWFGQQMQNAGMVSPNRNPVAEGFAGLLAVDPKASAKAVGGAALGLMGAAGDAGAMDRAMMLYHGSPRPLDGGVFDLAKVGSNTHANTEGWGAYHSLEKKNAQRFGSNLTKVDIPDDVAAQVLLDWQKPISQQSPLVQRIASFYEKDAADPAAAAQNFFRWQKSIGRMDTVKKGIAAKLGTSIYQDVGVAKVDLDKFKQISADLTPRNPEYYVSQIIGSQLKNGKSLYDLIRNTNAGSQKSAAGLLDAFGVKGAIMDASADLYSVVPGSRNVVIHNQDLLNDYTVKSKK